MRMRHQLALVLVAAAAPAYGFRAANFVHAPVHTNTIARCGRGADVVMAREGGKSPGLYLRTAVLTLLAYQSATGLYVDVPRLLGERPDFFATLIDGGILVYASRLLLGQAGVIRADTSAAISLDGMTCRATLNLGREPGTWMPPEWGSSGARLSLPMTLRFTDEPLDMGFPGRCNLPRSPHLPMPSTTFSDWRSQRLDLDASPGEEALGGRYAKRVVVEESASFVGASGAVEVSSSSQPPPSFVMPSPPYRTW